MNHTNPVIWITFPIGPLAESTSPIRLSTHAETLLLMLLTRYEKMQTRESKKKTTGMTKLKAANSPGCPRSSGPAG